MNEILIRYGELFLKSEPVRRVYEKKLRRNIKIGLKQEGINFDMYRTHGRIFIRTKQVKKACELLKRIFGLVSVSPCYHLKTSELKEIQKFCKKNYSQWVEKGKTFAVRAKRVGSHTYTSHDLAKAVGDVINRKVDLTNPDVEVFVEVRGKDCYVYTDVIKCPGGMPLSSSGKVVCLVSGGIDSPVATWMMMKRGCTVAPLFAYFSRSDESYLKRFLEVMKILNKWYVGRKLRLFIFKHDQSLTEFRKIAYRHTCVLCRRMMYRVANEVAKKLNAKAIVTGENLGQVASQTLYNLRVIDEVSELPVLRPIIGMDKTESIEMAKRIGTYEASCTSITSGCGDVRGCWARPDKPVTKAKLEEIEAIEKEIDVKSLVKKSMRSLKEISV
jgi:thiamine biosynthesis protein ThiI